MIQTRSDARQQAFAAETLGTPGGNAGPWSLAPPAFPRHWVSSHHCLLKGTVLPFLQGVLSFRFNSSIFVNSFTASAALALSTGRKYNDHMDTHKNSSSWTLLHSCQSLQIKCWPQPFNQFPGRGAGILKDADTREPDPEPQSWNQQHQWHVRDWRVGDSTMND